MIFKTHEMENLISFKKPYVSFTLGDYKIEFLFENSSNMNSGTYTRSSNVKILSHSVTSPRVMMNEL